MKVFVHVHPSLLQEAVHEKGCMPWKASEVVAWFWDPAETAGTFSERKFCGILGLCWNHAGTGTLELPGGTFLESCLAAIC